MPNDSFWEYLDLKPMTMPAVDSVNKVVLIVESNKGPLYIFDDYPENVLFFASYFEECNPHKTLMQQIEDALRAPTPNKK